MHRIAPCVITLVFGAFGVGACAPNDWGLNAAEHRGRIGEFVEYACPGGGALGSVWGTGTYTDDSSVCTAAVHAGAISRSSGGAVTIEILGGLASYCGSTRNGVTSRDWGNWIGSFRVLGATAISCEDPPTSNCSPACSGADVCVMWGTSGYACGGRCGSDAECVSGCCASLSDGSRACAPDSSFCGACGTCGAGEICVNWTGVGPRCSARCSSSPSCGSGCCGAVSDGSMACAPSSSFCSAGCPPGEFPLYEGGPCEPPVPSTCPNDWVVCTCPETHGVWCHEMCAFAFCDGSPCVP